MDEQGKYPEIPVAILDMDEDHDGYGVPYSVASGQRYLAICIVNPQLRTTGSTKKDAVRRLKQMILSNFNQKHHVEYATISLDEELIAEIMDE